MLLLSAAAVFTAVTAVYYLSYRLYSGRDEPLPYSETQENRVILAGQGTTGGADTGSGERAVSQNGAKQNGADLVLQSQGESAWQANEDMEIYITPRMTYTLESYNVSTGEFTSAQEKIPMEVYGFTRSELEEYLPELAQEENNVGAGQAVAGETQTVVTYSLLSFSRDGFTLRRTISQKEPEYALFLISENGFLVAYTGDRTQVFEETKIPLGDFPLEQQAMLTQGIFMKSLTDYYDFLETYSS